MAISREALHALVIKKFPDAEFEIIDLAGDGDHYQLNIASAQFSGMTPIAQHRLVYQALGEMVGNSLHALALKTKVK